MKRNYNMLKSLESINYLFKVSGIPDKTLLKGKFRILSYEGVKV